MTTLGNHLLVTVNKLQDLVFNTIGNDSLDLPQIVVVGSQSSGKSSVIENIVGRDFLPRGSGIVTRRPLILQLINIPRVDDDDDADKPPSSAPSEWAEFNHQPGQRYTDFAHVRQEIENETSRIAGNNKGINRQPINLKVFSPQVLNLTLVDLPGLTKVPIGDQPSDIEKQTRNLISEYIAKPNSIILAVSPANVDIVNSEALKLARHVDPLGVRTIGVLTKVDLMDHGTNAMDILSGRVYPLKLGFIAVVNRSQQDIQNGKPLQDALGNEQEFFRLHPAYRNISQRCGTSFLAKILNTTLMAHIRERLPDIKARLNTLMGQAQQELASYGSIQFSGKESQGSLILQLMTRFASSFISSIDGTSSDISTKELCGGARIYYIFNSVFGSSLSHIDPVQNLSVVDIQTAIRNSTGPRPSLFVPEMAFDLLVRPQIKLLEIPSQRCVELVYEELIKVCHTCGFQELSHFPRLQAKLIEVVSELLREQLGPCSKYVESLNAIQRAYINTNHPNFLGAASAMSLVIQDRQERERKQALAEARSKKEKTKMRELELDGDVTQQQQQQQQQQGDVEEEGVETERRSRRREGLSSSASPSTKARHAAQSQAMHDVLSSGLTNGSASRQLAPPSSSSARSSSSMARDSFLNYFFGKDGSQLSSLSQPPVSLPQTQPMQSQHSQRSLPLRPISRQSNDISTHHAFSFAEPRQPPVTDAMPFADAHDGLNQSSSEGALSDREELESELIQKLIWSYFGIVRETIADQVPKAIMHLLVNHTKEVVQNRLVSELYREELFNDLLHEDDGIKDEREKCEKLLQTYKEAAKIVGEVL